MLQDLLTEAQSWSSILCLDKTPTNVYTPSPRLSGDSLKQTVKFETVVALGWTPALTENPSSKSPWTAEWGHWSSWDGVDRNHPALPASQFFNALVHSLPLAIAELRLVPVRGLPGWDLLSSGVPPAEPHGFSSCEHGVRDRGQPRTMCLIFTHLIF